MLVEEAIDKRKSIRSFTDEPLSIEEVAKLHWAALKVPSAGGVHPLKVHIVDDKDLKEKLCHAALNQKAIREAPVVLVVTADFSAMLKRYGKRGYRYVFIEVGHAGQNISLMAVSLGLGTVMIGAFKDAEVKEVLGIEQEPIYIIPVGRKYAI